MSEPREQLEQIGNIIVGGFGDRVLIGALIGLLDNTTPGKCYQAIINNKSLLDDVNMDELSKFANIIKGYRIGKITYDEVVDTLRGHRPDLLGMVINTPDGEQWLRNQVDIIKIKFGV